MFSMNFIVFQGYFELGLVLRKVCNFLLFLQKTRICSKGVGNEGDDGESQDPHDVLFPTCDFSQIICVIGM